MIIADADWNNYIFIQYFLIYVLIFLSLMEESWKILRAMIVFESLKVLLEKFLVILSNQ